MRFIDDKGRVFGKLNLIDLGLVLLVLAAVAFAGVKLLNTDDLPVITAERQNVTVTIFGNAIHPFVVDKIKTGDVVRLKENNAVLGKIVDVRTGPAKLIASTAEGKWVNSEVPDKFTVYIDVEGQAVKSNGSFVIGDTPMLVGAEIEIKGPKFTLKGLISDVK